MASRRTTVRGGASAGVAWERYARPAQWSTWALPIRGVDYAFDRLVAGTSGRVRSYGSELPFTITAVDEPEMTWSWVVHLPGLTLDFDHAVRAHSSGCETELVAEGPALVVAAYLPVAALSLRRLVAT